MADKTAPKEVDLKDAFAKEAKDPAMIAYLKSLGPCLLSALSISNFAIPWQVATSFSVLLSLDDCRPSWFLVIRLLSSVSVHILGCLASFLVQIILVYFFSHLARVLRLTSLRRLRLAIFLSRCLVIPSFGSLKCFLLSFSCHFVAS